MRFFQYKDKQLYCENVPLQQIANEVGTPAFVYSKNAFLTNYDNIREQFKPLRDFQICYAAKANSNPTILKALAEKGAGADVVSGGELFLALKCGFPANKIVFAGVGKTDEDIEFALENDIMSFNAESVQEIDVINELAGRQNKVAPISLRINADIDIEGHPFITTGTSDNKFGIDIQEIKAMTPHILSLPNVKLVGLHSHTGSQIYDHNPYLRSISILTALKADLAAAGCKLNFIDIGGGLGVDYESDLSVSKRIKFELLTEIIPELRKIDCKVIFEPGRSIIADAGILLSKVLFNKQTRNKTFIVVDAGMTELIRPSLYSAFHQVVPVEKGGGVESEVDIVGPICESTDFLAKNRKMPKLQRHDLVAVLTAGAYGYSLASNYNSRQRPVEVLVDDDKFKVIRKRETKEQLLD